MLDFLMPAVIAPEVFKTVLLHQASLAVSMKQRWLEHCCVLAPLAATRKLCQKLFLNSKFLKKRRTQKR